MSRENDASRGVADAWSFWLADHPITVDEIISEAVDRAVTRWINEHEPAILKVIADVIHIKARE